MNEGVFHTDSRLLCHYMMLSSPPRSPEGCSHQCDNLCFIPPTMGHVALSTQGVGLATIGLCTRCADGVASIGCPITSADVLAREPKARFGISLGYLLLYSRCWSARRAAPQKMVRRRGKIGSKMGRSEAKSNIFFHGTEKLIIK